LTPAVRYNVTCNFMNNIWPCIQKLEMYVMMQRNYRINIVSCCQIQEM
jgi:hypothetical protein